MFRSTRAFQTTIGLFLLCTLPVALAHASEPKGGLPVTRPGELGMDAAKLAEIPKRMQEFVDANQASGIVTLVAKDGKIAHLSAVGKADLAEDRAMRTDSVFAVASMTKPITATAVMILQDEGKLNVEDPVSKYIPEFKDAVLKQGKLEREIMIRDVLTHTSGLGGDQKNEGSIADTAKLLAKRPLDFQPGTKWQYSPGLTVAGRVVEVASGMPYEKFLDTRIFQPLGMTETTFFPNNELQARIAKLYEPGEDKKSLKQAKHWINDLSPGRTANPSGGLFSTASDMARFYQMVLNGGTWNGRRIVSEKSVRDMTQIQTGDLQTGFTAGNGWGFGWCVVREPQGVSGMLSPGSFGHGGAFGTQGWVDPKRDMIFVLMLQRTSFGNSDDSDIRKAFQQIAVDAVRK